MKLIKVDLAVTEMEASDTDRAVEINSNGKRLCFFLLAAKRASEISID